MLPTVDFCGLNVTRLILGANPFGGFSHQNRARDAEMVAWSTPERIRETWDRAWTAGINTFITNNETPHVIDTTTEYLASGGPMQWIGQISARGFNDCMEAALDRAVEIGAAAAYIHGGYTDSLYSARDAETFCRWIRYGQSLGIPMGCAGHSSEAHLWVNSLDVVDFQVVCFFNCGSLHAGKGEKFRLADAFQAVQAIQQIQKPCIGYKILGAGRIDAKMGFEFALENIKPGDVVNVGMHRGDNDDVVEDNAKIVNDILGSLEPVPA